MAFKHYDVVRAASPSDLAEKLTHKLKEGWQPFGSPVAITPYTLMQAIAAEGDVVVSGATEPGDTTSSYWPGIPGHKRRSGSGTKCTDADGYYQKCNVWR